MFGEETAERQYSEKKLHNKNRSTMKTQTDIGKNPLKSNGADVMQDVSRTRGWDIPRTGGRDARREPDSGVGYTQD